MPLTVQMESVLRTIHNDTSKGGYSFAKANYPLVRALVSSGHIVALKNPAGGPIIDPGNQDKQAYALTAEGMNALPPDATGGNPPPVAPIEQPEPIAAGVVGQPAGFIGSSAAAGLPVGVLIGQPGTNLPPGPVSPAAPAAGAAAKPKKAKPEVVFTGAVFGAIPAGIVRKRGGGNRGAKEVYPFSSLQAPVTDPATGAITWPGTFFVAKSPAAPDPYKTLRPSVNAANKRFEAEGRKFKVFEYEDDMEHHKPGARVFRIK